MTCRACANRIEKVLNKKISYSEAGVNFASEDSPDYIRQQQNLARSNRPNHRETGYKATLHTDGAEPDVTSNTQFGLALLVLILHQYPVFKSAWPA